MKKLLFLCGMFLLSMTAMAEGTEPEKIDVEGTCEDYFRRR